MESIRVRAVPGRAYPKPGGAPGEFVGLVQAPAGTSDALFEVGGGVAYVSAGVVEVPSSAEIRRAIAKGDLEAVVDDNEPSEGGV